jgi:hypothetical protein
MSEDNLPKDEPRTIDEAITTCDKIIFWHRFYSLLMLILLVACTFAFYKAFNALEKISENVEATEIGKLISADGSEFLSRNTKFTYMILGLYLVVFGVLVAIYRFHLVEISRNEQIKLGFWRIRIAARNTDPGFQTEVRQSLTKDAFTFNRKAQNEKSKEVESPIPGHPGSDLAAAVLNKILENVEVNVSKKSQ